MESREQSRQEAYDGDAGVVADELFDVVHRQNGQRQQDRRLQSGHNTNTDHQHRSVFAAPMLVSPGS